jgi:hypothetical protein
MLIKLNETTEARRTIYFTAVYSTTDAVYTGTLSGADIQISKAGGAEATSTGTATHIATGLFKYEFAAAEVDTLGEVSIRLAKTDVYNDVRVINIVAFDPYNATSLGVTNIAVATPEVADWLDEANTIETGVTIRGALRLLAAALAGKISGGGTTTITIRNAVADSKARITATVDSSGNRTAITTDQT